MAAGRLIFPGMMPAVDDVGDRIPGAKAYFYVNLTTTPATVYSDSGLSVPLTNPVEADSLGVWPAMWADTATAFTVALADGDGVPIPGQTWSGLSSAIDATLASVALASGSANQASASAASALGAPGTNATSVTPLVIGTGVKVFALAQTGKALSKGQRVVAASDANPLNQMSGVITAFADPTLTVSIDTVSGAGSHSDWDIGLTGDGAVSSVAGLSGAVSGTNLKTSLAIDQVQNLPVAGRTAIWIPAAAMTPRITNGPAANQVETATNKVQIRSLDFDASTRQFAQFAFRMPKSWDAGNISAVFEWSHAAAVTNFGVSWGIQGVAISDHDAGDAAFGTAQQANDVGGTTNTFYASPETAAVTIAGAPAAEDVVVFTVFRVADDAVNDTLSVNARLHGVTLYINTAAGTDA